MEQSAKARQVLRFGAFEVDIQERELRRSGLKVKIQEQPFQILTMLLERPGAVVGREELQKAVWPNGTFVDFEHGLNTAVKKLREALGDEPDNPRFIETVPRRGYRFIAPVNGSPGDRNDVSTLSAPAPVASGSALPQAKRWSPGLWLAVAAVVVIGAGIALWILWPRPHPNANQENIEVRLTANSAENPVTGAAISPDARYLAYSDSTGIYLKLIRTGETHPIALPQGFFGTPAGWFSDGAHLLLIAAENSGAQMGLWTISVIGGSPRKLADSASLATISPDGSHIALVRGMVRELRPWLLLGNEIWVIRSDGTLPVKLAVANSAVGGLAWAPDGKSLAYIRRDLATQAMFVEVAKLGDMRSHALFSDPGLGSALSWLADGRLAYTLAEKPPHQRDSNVWTVSLDRSPKLSGIPARLTRIPGWILSLTATPDSKHLGILRTSLRAHVFLARLAPDQNELLNVRRMTLVDNRNLPTSWTADSKEVLFASDRNGHFEIFKQAIGQDLAETLVSVPGNALTPRLSPDGSEVLYLWSSENAPADALVSVFAVPVAGGVPRLVLRMAGLVNVGCARAPVKFCVCSTGGGKWSTFFHFDPKTGQYSELARIESADVNWSLSPDGSELAIIYAPARTILLRSMVSGRTREIAVKGWAGLSHVDWAADSKSLFVGSIDPAGHTALLHVTFDGTAHSLLQEHMAAHWAARAPWAIPSPDGRSLAMFVPTRTSNVWSLDNF